MSPHTVNTIKAVVAEHFKIPVDAMDRRDRRAHIAWPRQVAMHATRQLTGRPYSYIGHAFDGRDHGTVLYACRDVEDRKRIYLRDAQDVEAVLLRARKLIQPQQYWII